MNVQYIVQWRLKGSQKDLNNKKEPKQFDRGNHNIFAKEDLSRTEVEE